MRNVSKFRFWLLLSALIITVSCGGEERTILDKIRINKQVVVGTDAVNIPFEFGQGTGVQGFDVDIANEIAKDLEVEVRWVKIPFERLFEALRDGEVDFVISAISITEERKKEFDFSKPYYESGQVIAIRRESQGITQLADLAGKRVGVQEGTTGDLFLTGQSSLTGVDRRVFSTIDDALLALNQRDLDAVIGDLPIVSYSTFTSFPAIRVIGQRLTTEQYGIMVSKSNPRLLEIINKTLDRIMAAGMDKELHTKWFQDVERGIAERAAQEAKMEQLKTTPKQIVFRMTKDPAFDFRMSRLDGFNVTLRNQDTGQVTNSTAIETTGNTGVCSVRVLPGFYIFSIKGYQLGEIELEVPLVEEMTLTSDVRIGNQFVVNRPK